MEHAKEYHYKQGWKQCWLECKLDSKTNYSLSYEPLPDLFHCNRAFPGESQFLPEGQPLFPSQTKYLQVEYNVQYRQQEKTGRVWKLHLL